MTCRPGIAYTMKPPNLQVRKQRLSRERRVVSRQSSLFVPKMLTFEILAVDSHFPQLHSYPLLISLHLITSILMAPDRSQGSKSASLTQRPRQNTVRRRKSPPIKPKPPDPERESEITHTSDRPGGRVDFPPDELLKTWFTGISNHEQIAMMGDSARLRRRAGRYNLSAPYQQPVFEANNGGYISPPQSSPACGRLTPGERAGVTEREPEHGQHDYSTPHPRTPLLPSHSPNLTQADPAQSYEPATPVSTHPLKPSPPLSTTPPTTPPNPSTPSPIHQVNLQRLYRLEASKRGACLVCRTQHYATIIPGTFFCTRCKRDFNCHSWDELPDDDISPVSESPPESELPSTPPPRPKPPKPLAERKMIILSAPTIPPRVSSLGKAGMGMTEQKRGLDSGYCPGDGDVSSISGCGSEGDVSSIRVGEVGRCTAIPSNAGEVMQDDLDEALREIDRVGYIRSELVRQGVRGAQVHPLPAHLAVRGQRYTQGSDILDMGDMRSSVESNGRWGRSKTDSGQRSDWELNLLSEYGRDINA
jgi:hypothetical protein